jgi:hypothetical protein
MKKLALNSIYKRLFDCFCEAEETEQESSDLILTALSELRFYNGDDLDGEKPEREILADDYYSCIEKIQYAAAYCDYYSKLDKKLYKVAADIEKKLKKAGY